jgi:hypothetical protein
MKLEDPTNRPLRAAPRLALLVMGAAGLTGALAGDYAGLPAHFGGLLNDYSPSSVNGVAIKGGPYEMHGTWTLDLDPSRNLASFSAAMDMATVDFLNASPTFDPGTLGAHTHHISVRNGIVHDGPTDWTTMCPKFAPAATGGFAITGTAYVTGNGGNAPFGNPSPITICVLGGTNPNVSGAAFVEFANVTLTFGSPASGHFGPQAIHGVVVSCGPPSWNSQPCGVTVDK